MGLMSGTRKASRRGSR
ncbi:MULTISPECIES: hypothetical protein [Agrobacterium tumefaciens complex]